MQVMVVNIDYMARGTTQYELLNGLSRPSYKTRLENIYDQLGRNVGIWLLPIYDKTI